MLSASNVRWDAAAPLTLVRRDSATVRVSFGVWIFDPSGIDSSFTARITYDARLFVGADGRLHTSKANPSCCYHYGMSDAVITQLDQALSRMTTRAAPHDPLRFGVDAATNVTWSFVPVVG
jgi:hypothetical protein